MYRIPQTAVGVAGWWRGVMASPRFQKATFYTKNGGMRQINSLPNMWEAYSDCVKVDVVTVC